MKLPSISVPIKYVIPSPSNNKNHSDEKVRRIAASLKRYGQVKDVVAQKQKHGDCYDLYAGHSVRLGALLNGWTHINVTVLPPEWDEVMCLGYLLSDNYTKAEEDVALYIRLMEQQQSEGVDLASVGSSDEELAALVLEHSMMMTSDVEGEAGEKREKMVTHATSKQQIKIVVYSEGLHVFEAAVKRSGLSNRGKAVEEICRYYLAQDSTLGETPDTDLY